MDYTPKQLPELAREFLRITSPPEAQREWRGQRDQARAMLRDCRRESYALTVDGGLDLYVVLDWLGEIVSEPVEDGWDEEPFEEEAESGVRQSDFIARSDWR